MIFEFKPTLRLAMEGEGVLMITYNPHTPVSLELCHLSCYLSLPCLDPWECYLTVKNLAQAWAKNLLSVPVRTVASAKKSPLFTGTWDFSAS